MAQLEPILSGLLASNCIIPCRNLLAKTLKKTHTTAEGVRQNSNLTSFSLTQTSNHKPPQRSRSDRKIRSPEFAIIDSAY